MGMKDSNGSSSRTVSEQLCLLLPPPLSFHFHLEMVVVEHLRPWEGGAFKSQDPDPIQLLYQTGQIRHTLSCKVLIILDLSSQRLHLDPHYF